MNFTIKRTPSGVPEKQYIIVKAPPGKTLEHLRIALKAELGELTGKNKRPNVYMLEQKQAGDCKLKIRIIICSDKFLVYMWWIRGKDEGISAEEVTSYVKPAVKKVLLPRKTYKTLRDNLHLNTEELLHMMNKDASSELEKVTPKNIRHQRKTYQAKPKGTGTVMMGERGKLTFKRVRGKDEGKKASVNIAQPTLIYIPGYGAGKDEAKAEHLSNMSQEMGWSYVRYDPYSIGDSEGESSTVEFEDWVESARTIIEKRGGKKNILIASDMGAWISLILLTSRLRLKADVVGLILIGPAVNCFQGVYLPQQQQQQHTTTTTYVMPRSRDTHGVETYFQMGGEEYCVNTTTVSGGAMEIPVPGGGLHRLGKSFLDKAAQFQINFHYPINVDIPVRILHGAADTVIPYRDSLTIMEQLVSKDVRINYIKTGDHTFQEPDCLNLLKETIVKLLEMHEVPAPPSPPSPPPSLPPPPLPQTSHPQPHHLHPLHHHHPHQALLTHDTAVYTGHPSHL